MLPCQTFVVSFATPHHVVCLSVPEGNVAKNEQYQCLFDERQARPQGTAANRNGAPLRRQTSVDASTDHNGRHQHTGTPSTPTGT